MTNLSTSKCLSWLQPLTSILTATQSSCQLSFAPWQCFQRASWASIHTLQVSHSWVPTGVPTSLLNQIFRGVPLSVHQCHWYHTVAPSPVHLIPLLCLLWRKRAPVLQNKPLSCSSCSQWPTAKKLYLVPCASVTRFARPDIGNGQETSASHIAAILPLPSMPRLSSTARPDLALFSAAFLTQMFQSDLKPKTNKKLNTLSLFFFLWKRLTPSFISICTQIQTKLHF